MGHYLAAVATHVDAIPLPARRPLPLDGTLGAVIKIREHSRNRRRSLRHRHRRAIAGFVGWSCRCSWPGSLGREPSDSAIRVARRTAAVSAAWVWGQVKPG